MFTPLTRPQGLAVTLDQLKGHLRIEDDDENDTLNGQLAAAIEYVERECNIALAPVTFQARLDSWFDDMRLPVSPVRDVATVSYLDGAGAEQSIAAEGWRWSRRNRRGGACVTLAEDLDLPEVYAAADQVVFVTWDAGFDLPDQSGSGDDPVLALPAVARQAVLLLAGHWYQNREDTTAGQLANLPKGVDALCNQLKVWQ